MKPGASNRGRGIALFRTAAAVEKHLAKQRRDDAFVAQAYLANPLLVRGRKFDVRVFALVAPDGGAYVYGDGYVRTCTTPYTVEDLADLSAHLTNDAVQRSLKGYGKHEDCNKLSFAEFQRALDAERLERPSRTDRGGSISRTTCGPRSSASPRARSARRWDAGLLGTGKTTTRVGVETSPSRARRSRCSVWISCWRATGRRR